ncbi:MAG: hypothetical protein V5A72_01830, partial [Candidatus Nanohaloarchaea archaeon]
INLKAVNSGQLEGEVNIGDKNKGDKVMFDYCGDHFEIKNFDAISSRTSENKQNYTLGQGERLEMSWVLEQKGGRIPQTGITCSIRFQLPFKYSVRAYKQIQIKENKGVEGSSELSSRSSAGPMRIDTEISGSTSDKPGTIIKGDEASLYITGYNRAENKDSPYTGLIEDTSLEVEPYSDKIEFVNDCGSSETAQLASGNKVIHKCDINTSKFPDSSTQSIESEITANINYTYVRDLGDKEIEVSPSGY